nr:ATP-dependent DNA ligase [Amycolatopsis palatopharyngis]
MAGARGPAGRGSQERRRPEAGESQREWGCGCRGPDTPPTGPWSIEFLSDDQNEGATAPGQGGLTDGSSRSPDLTWPSRDGFPLQVASDFANSCTFLFDLLFFDGSDARPLPLRQRKRLLREAFDFTGPLRFSSHRNGDGEKYYQLACARGWEGLIAKRATAPYQGGRSKDWLKFKCVREQEFVVGGFTEPNGSRMGFGALLLGYYDHGSLRFAGKVGTGYDTAMLRHLRGRLDELRVPATPFAEPVRERGTHWVRPELVVQVTFAEWTGDGKLRHGRFTGIRDDKSAGEVVREAG